MKSVSRRRARECAVQALYSWQISKNNINDIKYQFLLEQDVKDVDLIYFNELLVGVTTNVRYIDNLIKHYVSRMFNKIDQVEKVILRIALFEISKRNDVPCKVVINEAIELTKIFGGEGSYKFINSVLDKIAFSIRSYK